MGRNLLLDDCPQDLASQTTPHGPTGGPGNMNVIFKGVQLMCIAFSAQASKQKLPSRVNALHYHERRHGGSLKRRRSGKLLIRHLEHRLRRCAVAILCTSLNF